jgi:hypothetical protein
MRRQRVVKLTLAAGMVGLLILPALVYTQVTGRVLNPRLRQTYTSLSAAVAAAAANDTLLVSGTLTDGNATLSAMQPIPDGLKIVAGRGLRGTLQVSTCPGGPAGAILNVSGRAGALTIQGLRLVVPNGCVGVYSDGTVSGGDPLTVRGLRIDRAAGAITGIFLDDETDGPFTIEQNVIPSVGGAGGIGILVDGDGATAITASVKGNTVGSAGSPTGFGIQVTDVPATSSVTVERNRVDGGNNASSVVGIVVDDSDGVIVRRNTVRNFVGTAAAQDAFGIEVVESPNTQVLRNVIANNDTGVAVDDDTTSGTETADTVVINDNNITSTVANATGLLFIPDSGVAAPAPLDATNNWWGAANGPKDDDTDTTDCPEATPPGCTTPPTAEGGGLPIATNPLAPQPNNDCDATPGSGAVTTCPFRTAPVSPAGA